MAVDNRTYAPGLYALGAIDIFFESIDEARPLMESKAPYRARLRALFESVPPAAPAAPQPQAAPAQAQAQSKSDEEDKGYDAGWHAAHRAGGAAGAAQAHPDKSAEWNKGYQAGWADGGDTHTIATHGPHPERSPEQAKASQEAAMRIFGRHHDGLVKRVQATSAHRSTVRALKADPQEPLLDPHYDWAGNVIKGSDESPGHTALERDIHNFTKSAQSAANPQGMRPSAFKKHLGSSAYNYFRDWSRAQLSQGKRGAAIVRKNTDAELAAKAGKRGQAEPGAAPEGAAKPEEPEEPPPEGTQTMGRREVAPSYDAEHPGERRAKPGYTGGEEEPERPGPIDVATKTHAQSLHGSDVDDDSRNALRAAVAGELSKLQHPTDWQPGQRSEREYIMRHMAQDMSPAAALKDMGLGSRADSQWASTVGKRFRTTLADHPDVRKHAPEGWSGEVGGLRKKADPTAPKKPKATKKPKDAVEALVARIYGLTLTEDTTWLTEDAVNAMFDAWFRQVMA